MTNALVTYWAHPLGPAASEQLLASLRIEAANWPPESRPRLAAALAMIGSIKAILALPPGVTLGGLASACWSGPRCRERRHRQRYTSGRDDPRISDIPLALERTVVSIREQLESGDPPFLREATLSVPRTPGLARLDVMPSSRLILIITWLICAFSSAALGGIH